MKGTTRERGAEIARFRDDAECRVFTASLRAGGLGIDLTSASVVIHYDRWWNQAREDQATDRVHRLGQSKGVQVRYGIHAVAGRMPGHMNVLLAEANVPYDELYDMDQINSQFPETDVVVVVGANDVVNPAAKRIRGSPIYGMPILEVEKARVVIVCKRSLAAGFAGIDNELYYGDKTLMLFGDAKEMMVKLTAALKE